MIQMVVLKTGGSVRKVCAVLGEARSSFYHASAPTATQAGDIGLGDLLEAVFRRHRRRYGYRRLAQDLSDR
jgi:putative transposase